MNQVPHHRAGTRQEPRLFQALRGPEAAALPPGHLQGFGRELPSALAVFPAASLFVSACPPTLQKHRVQSQYRHLSDCLSSPLNHYSAITHPDSSLLILLPLIFHLYFTIETSSSWDPLFSLCAIPSWKHFFLFNCRIHILQHLGIIWVLYPAWPSPWWINTTICILTPTLVVVH